MKKKEREKALMLTEVFHPEDFLINDLTRQWEKNGYDFEVLTRAPSYLYGKVYEEYKNRIYQTTFFNTIKIHHSPVLQGYQRSVFIKILNYLSFVFWSVCIVLSIGRRFDRVFIFQTVLLTLATAGILMKKLFGAKVTIWTQDM
ncbi:hypothetical protein [Alistipes indistinctus]|uniref:hypothetical protein n=1 Tax=Alistipes indistinctus TaxID=626932 RepID=UPI00241E7AA5|nr:hypothetical protein [Alistipes indistinctus]